MALTPDQIKDLVLALESQGGAVGQLKQRLEQLTEAQLQFAQAEAAATSASQKTIDILDKQAAANDRVTASLERQQEAAQKQLNAASDLASTAEKEIAAAEAQIEIFENEIRLRGDNNNLMQEGIDTLIKDIEKRKEQIPQLKKTDAAMKDLGGSITNMLSGSAPKLDSMLNAKNLKGIAGKFKDLVKHPKGLAVGLKSMAKANAHMMIAQLAVATVKLAKDLGDTENAFMRATNASRDFARNITRTYEEGRKFAMAAKDMTAAGVALTTTFTDFTFASSGAQREMVTATAALAKLGMSNQASAQSLQLLTKSFGQTGVEGVQTLANLEKFAENLEVPLSKLSADFIAAGDSLAKLGDNGDEAFRRLAKITKVTGLEMNKLLNIVNQFDTFEGAARQAGKLNAALGGNFVNAMDLMMETDPAARFEQIRSAILDSGLSFKEMSYYQRNFYKDALGLQSVADLAQVLSGDMSAVTDETMKSEQELLALKEQARVTASFQEQLNAVFAQMIPIITPMIDGISGFIGVLSDLAPVLKIVGLTLIGSIFGPAGAAVGAIIALMDTIKLGEDKVSLLSALFEGLLLPFKELGAVFGDFKSYINDMLEPLGGISGTVETLQEKLSFLLPVIKFIGASLTMGLAVAIGTIVAPVMLVITLFSKLLVGLQALGNMMFKESFASSFLDGLVKVGNAIGSIAESVITALNPITQMTNFVKALGNTFTGIIDSVSSFFTVLTAPEAAQNMKDIANAITAIPTTKNLEFVASMAAAAGTATIGSAVSTVTAIGGAAAEGISDFFGGDDTKESVTDVRIISDNRDQELTVNLMVDRDKLATVIEKINGREALRAATSRD